MLLKIISACQGLTEIIPPDLEEKLCVVAIINDSKKQNMIIVEKSYQREYPSDEKAHLEELSVMIRSEKQIVFEYFNPYSENRIDTIYLPTGIDFIPNQKYTLTISEKNTETVTSETVVPEYPPDFEIFVEGTVQTFLPPPLECYNPVNSIILNLKFQRENDFSYYIDISGEKHASSNDTTRHLINYDILESNSAYFVTIIHGFTSPQFNPCYADWAIRSTNDYKVCFINGKTVPDSSCNLNIKIDLNKYVFDYKNPIQVSLNSIPNDLYVFEKSYFTYRETLFDPFSEPVYLISNIKGGSGIFAICSSKQYSLTLPTD